jgi:hypothetical protein
MGKKKGGEFDYSKANNHKIDNLLESEGMNPPLQTQEKR